MIYFIEFINKVSSICRQLHSFRQILSNETHMNYYQIFKRIDTSRKGYISSNNLMQILELQQTNAKIIMRQYSQVIGTLKLMEFKELLDLSSSVKKQNTLKDKEILFIVKAIMELQCKYIIEANEVRKDMRKLDVRTVLDIFHKLDQKNMSYININDIRLFLLKQDAEVPQYLQLVLRKQFKYQLVSFQQFYDFFQKPDRGGISLQKSPPQQQPKSSKRVRFNFQTIKTPKKKKGATSKKQHRSISKKSRNSTPQKFKTMSPKRWQEMTLDHEENKHKLFLRFHLDTIKKETRKNFGRYFKLYSVYN